ncbi:MAG: hypothetical protein FJX59_03455 [Alphaproteobacteria bacterium]|nr:hypothetical protein [Alphaproteobacteria bacterium]
MLFAVVFTDDRKRLNVRHDRMKDHLAFLKRNKKSILAAGSLRLRPDGPAGGALWIVAAKDISRVKALIARDPFSVHRLRKRVAIRYWSTAMMSAHDVAER